MQHVPRTISISRDNAHWLDARYCGGMLSRMRGLMLAPPSAALFVFPVRQRVCLHMFFMRFPLTALFMDDQKRVVEIQQLRPWQIGKASAERVRYVLELPIHEAIPIGTQLDW